MMYNLQTKFFFFLLFITLSMSGQASSLTDIVFLREKIINGKLELCVAHTGHGQVIIDPPVGQRNLNYSKSKEFPNLQHRLNDCCFIISQPTVEFKLIGRDGMGRVKVGPWVYVSAVNNKIKQFSTRNNQLYKDQNLYNEDL